MGVITALVSAKGGSGTTTMAACIGAALAERGEKTLLIDLNFRTDDLSILFGAENRTAYHLLDVIEGNCRIIQAMIPDGSRTNLHLLPASSSRGLERIPETSFVKLTEMLKGSFDRILIDTPSGFSAGLDYALSASDSAVLIVTPDHLSLRDSARLLRHPGFSGVQKCFILNRFRRRLTGENGFPTPEETAKTIGEPLLGIVPEDEELLLLTEYGGTAGELSGPVGKCFGNIAGRLCGEEIPISLKHYRN